MITLTREEAQQVLDALTRIRWAASERDKKNRVRDFDDAMDVSLASIETLRAKLSEPTIDGWPLHSGLPTPPDNFIDAVRYGTAINQGGQRIDPTKIYKEPKPEPVAWLNKLGNGEWRADK